jgi:peptidoglycan hydrolase CwlO-like protein
MAVTTDTEVRELRELILSLREEMRIGFVQMDTKFVELKTELKGEIQRVEAKADVKLAELNGKIDEAKAELNGKIDETKAELNGKIDEVKAELGGKIDVLEERTRVGFWGFIGRAVIIGLIGGAIAFGTKFFLTGKLTF